MESIGETISRSEGEGSADAAHKLYRDFGNGDIEAVLGSFDPDIEWKEAEGNPYQPDGAPWRGPQAIVEKLFIPLGTEWDGFTVTPHTFHAGDDGVVVVEGRYTGRFKATSRDIDAEVCHILTYRRGKLTRFRQYVDTAQMRAVMGA